MTLRLARMKPQVRDVLEADGFVARIGDDHIHRNIPGAVEVAVEELRRGP